MEVVAEGVETADQLEILRELDCDVVQGFLLGRPGTPEQIESLVQPTRPVALG
jgi:EAL domain-containing protein (putative c-di-GMP-specific phosphodiesterase class I)